MESEPSDRDDDRSAEESGEEHPHVRAAAELSDRAAESVGRRYDGTKESTHEAHGTDQQRPEDDDA